jgi:hypothetical protein
VTEKKVTLNPDGSAYREEGDLGALVGEWEAEAKQARRRSIRVVLTPKRRKRR